MTATETPVGAPVVGTSLLRKEDPPLLTGESRFVDDLVVPGALHMAVVRSPYAHARIRSVNVDAAVARPGVVAAFSGADLRSEWAGPMPCAWPVTEDMRNPEHLTQVVDEQQARLHLVLVLHAVHRDRDLHQCLPILVDRPPPGAGPIMSRTGEPC